MSKWIVQLQKGHGYSPTRRKQFEDKDEANTYYYYLRRSNFCNPYDVPVVFTEISR